MKQLLSWSVLLLLVACTLPVTAAADENCDGVYVQNADGHKAITASANNPVHVTLVKDKIEVYLNLDEDSPTDCVSKDFGTVSLGTCTIKYKFNQGQVSDLTVEVKGQANAATFAYEEDAPHQARMDFSSQGIMIRGPSVAGSLIPNTNDCWKPDSNLLTLDKVTNDCRLQLEFLEDVIGEVKLDSTKCDKPGPGPAPSDQPTPPGDTDQPGSSDETKPSGPGATTPVQQVPSGETNPSDPGATTPVQTLPSGETNPSDSGATTPVQPKPSDKINPTDPGPTTPGAPTTTAEGSDSLVIIIVCSVVGVLLLLIIVGIVVYCCIFKKKKKDNEEDAEAAEPKDQDAEADGAQKSEKKEPDAADGPEAENTQRDSEKKASDQTQSEGADNTQNE